MIRFLGKRLLQLIVIMFCISFITYGFVYLSPGDPAEMQLTANNIPPTEEALTALREEMGLNEPFIVQYTTWLTSFLQGDFGYSYHFKAPVYDVVLERMPLTLTLATTAFVLFVTVSLLLGVASAVWHHRLIDWCVRVLSFVAISMPSFWLGLVLLYVFAVQLQLLPVAYSNTWYGVILPAVTLALPLIGKYTRLIRAEVLTHLYSDYVIGAHVMGTKKRHQLTHYVLPNAILYIVPLIGLSSAALLGGTVIVELIFSWNGLGRMALDAITYRDYALLQAYVLLMTSIYVAVNALVDIAVQLLDPRIARNEELA